VLICYNANDIPASIGVGKRSDASRDFFFFRRKLTFEFNVVALTNITFDKNI